MDDFSVRPKKEGQEIIKMFFLYISDEIGRFFIQYNNVPMGAEKVGNRLFVTIPRRRFGEFCCYFTTYYITKSLSAVCPYVGLEALAQNINYEFWRRAFLPIQ